MVEPTNAIPEHGIKMKSIKLWLCSINFIFIITAIIFIISGVMALRSQKQFSYFLEFRSSSPPAIILITVGIIIFIVAALGIHGALKESTCMVLSFATILSVALIFEFTAAITAYAYRDEVIEGIKDNMLHAFRNYNSSAQDVITKSVDFLQENFGCCGFNGPNDWHKEYVMTGNDWHTMRDLDLFVITLLPPSCMNAEYFANTRDKVAYKEGCFNLLARKVEMKIFYLILLAIVVIFVQITGIKYAFSLGRAIRQQKTEREVLKWQMSSEFIADFKPTDKTFSVIDALKTDA